MKKVDWILVVSTLALLFGIGLSILILPQRSFSEEENRALTTWSTPSLQGLADGSVTERLRSVYADQFPFRASLISLKANLERALGKKENNGIFFGRNGYLIPRSEYSDLSVAQKNLDALAALENTAGIPCSLLIAPRSMDVMRACLPPLYESDDAIFSLLEESDVTCTLPLDSLQAAAERGESVWYRTDHHWTTYGAYLAYAAVADSLGVSPFPLSFFQREAVSDTFLGTSHSKVGMIRTTPDTVTLFRYKRDETAVLTDGETGETRLGFYEWDALAQKNQYELFLGGNVSRLSVSLAKEEDRPRLLLIKDSFACSLVPFLALHFDLELVDPRYYRGTLTDLLREERFDRILTVHGLDTLATDGSLSALLR